jgi:hypothetical protein
MGFVSHNVHPLLREPKETYVCRLIVPVLLSRVPIQLPNNLSHFVKFTGWPSGVSMAAELGGMQSKAVLEGFGAW